MGNRQHLGVSRHRAGLCPVVVIAAAVVFTKRRKERTRRRARKKKENSGGGGDEEKDESGEIRKASAGESGKAQVCSAELLKASLIVRR